MKYIFMLALVFVTAFAADDTLDIEAVINDPKELETFAFCFNGKDECNDALAVYKKDIKEAFEDGCATCSPKEKHDLRRFIEGLKEKMPAEYKVFIKKYDPESKYYGALSAAIAGA